jgi:outer membrane protein assembly factor BamB
MDNSRGLKSTQRVTWWPAPVFLAIGAAALAVVHDGFVYGLDDKILTCLDLATGQRRWRGGRYGYGQLLLTGDVLLVQAEGGEIALVEATPVEFRELARFTALAHRTWCHPVLAGSLLLVRNDREIACFDLSPRK